MKAFVPRGARIGDLPSVLGLEMIREAKEVTARGVVGARYVFGASLAVRAVGVAMDAAAEKASLTVLEETTYHGRSFGRSALPYFPTSVSSVNGNVIRIRNG